MAAGRKRRSPNTSNYFIRELDKAVGNKCLEDIEERAGLARNTVGMWLREERNPILANFQAVLNVLGYRLTIERIPE